MSNEVPPEDRSWNEADEALFRLKVGLRRARSVLEEARADIQRANDVATLDDAQIEASSR